MSDYIPTTAEVRDAYSSESSDSKFANRAFDLWLARYKAKIIAQTEERIIRLLEALATHKDCNLGEHHEDYVFNNPLGIIEVLTEWNSEPIALIKGEK